MWGWIGVDLDGTLARYDGWKGIEHIGEPIPAMVERVKRWLSDGHPEHGPVEVRIFTARVFRSAGNADPSHEHRVREVVEAWCVEHIGQKLAVTCVKDFGMLELWDDRAVQVEANTGHRMDGQPEPQGPP